MSALDTVQQKLIGTIALDPGLTSQGASDAVKNLCAFSATFNKSAADGMASTATSATKFITFSNPLSTPLRVSRVVINPGGSLTQDAANTANIIISTDDGVGGAAATCCTLVTTPVASGGTGTWAANTAIVATEAMFTQANRVVGAGGNLWLTISKNGTGVVVPILNITVLLEKL